MGIRVRDMIVILPGIMGSALEDASGRPLWSPGFGMAKKLIGRKSWIRELSITVADDAADTAFLGGVRPRHLVDSMTIVPGIVRIGGYTELHEALVRNFELIEGDQHEPTRRVDGLSGAPPNYFRFAYDWRRDNRASALQLRDLIDIALPAWRRVQPQARVILIAHSMGGLVARWYLEGVDAATGDRLEGWRNVRQLISFGTPYRGSMNALGYLAKGYRQLFIDFAPALESFSSVYQLLPRYAAVCDARQAAVPQWTKPRDVTGVSSLDHRRAVEAHDEFYVAIDDGVARHRDIDGYDDRFVTPIIGFGHDTINSVLLTPTDIELLTDLPADIVPPNWTGGDGTVPFVSALPLDYDGMDRPAPVRYVNEKHGTMQTNSRVLAAEIVRTVAATQQSGSAARELPVTAPKDVADNVVGEPQLGLNLPDYILAGTPVSVTITQSNVEPADIAVDVVDLGTGSTVRTNIDAAATATVEFTLIPGEYRISATRTKALAGIGALAATDGFAVLDPEEAKND
jgi:pimeloyl-ACP methyl ester carboxylesterase